MSELLSAMIDRISTTGIMLAMAIALAGGVALLARNAVAEPARYPLLRLMGVGILLSTFGCFVLFFGGTWFAFRGDQHRDAVLLVLQLLFAILLGTGLSQMSMHKKGALTLDHNWKYVFLIMYLVIHGWGLINVILSSGNSLYALIPPEGIEGVLNRNTARYAARVEIGESAAIMGAPLSSLLLKLLKYLTSGVILMTRIRDDGAVAIIICLVAMMLLSGTCLFIAQRKEENLAVRLTLSAGLSISVPMVASFATMDLALFAMCFLMLGITLYRSTRNAVRELGLVFWALAVALKPELFVFCLLLLLEKRFLDMLRVVCYGMLLIYLPLFILGGWDQMVLYLQLSWMRMYHELTLVGAGNTGVHFAAVFGNLQALICGSYGVGRLYLAAGMGFAGLLLLCSVIHRGWRKLLCICLILCGFVYSRAGNAALYVLIPFVAFLDEAPKPGRGYAWYLFLFTCLLAVFPAGTLGNIDAVPLWSKMYTFQTLTMFIQSSALFCLGISMAAEAAVKIRKRMFPDLRKGGSDEKN